MTLAALRDDALSSTTDGFALRLSLPWIRSLPLASLDALEVVVDGERVDRARRSRSATASSIPPRSPQERGVVVPAGPRRPPRAHGCCAPASTTSPSRSAS